MDARFLPSRVLGLEEGEAHIIRNAGGVITDDQIRSLAISQTLLGTREIILIHHTDCGLEGLFDEGRFAAPPHGTPRAASRRGRLGRSQSVDESVRGVAIRRLHASPFIVHKNRARIRL